MTEEIKQQATEADLITAITAAVNDIAKVKYVSQITMLGVLNALRIEQEHLFWEGQMRFREQKSAGENNVLQ